MKNFFLGRLWACACRSSPPFPTGVSPRWGCPASGAFGVGAVFCLCVAGRSPVPARALVGPCVALAPLLPLPYLCPSRLWLLPFRGPRFPGSSSFRFVASVCLVSYSVVRNGPGGIPLERGRPATAPPPIRSCRDERLASLPDPFPPVKARLATLLALALASLLALACASPGLAPILVTDHPALWIGPASIVAPRTASRRRRWFAKSPSPVACAPSLVHLPPLASQCG